MSIMFGSFAMIGWGVSDYMAKRILGKTGTYRTTIYSELVGLIPIVLLFIARGPIFSDWSGTIGLAFVAGAIHIICICTFYGALYWGQASVVAPLTASWGVVSTLISICFLGEKLESIVALLIVLVILGAILISFQPDPSGAGSLKRALPLAFVSTVATGFNAVLMKFVALGLGDVGAVFYTRVFSAIMMLPGLFIIARRSGWLPQALDLRRRIFLASLGVINALAFVGYVTGITLGNVSIVAPVAASSPAVTFILAELLLKERVRPHQGLGVFLVLAGVVALAVFA